jgi:hypothetical protein
MEENELFGETHEQEENGLFGRRHKAEQLNLCDVGKSVVCGNCDGWGYTVDENGRRKDHCKECE